MTDPIGIYNWRRLDERLTTSGQPTEADLAAFCALMDGLLDKTIHVHCIANFRVSAFVYRYRVDRLGWDRGRAAPDLEAIWRPEGPWAAIVAD